MKTRDQFVAELYKDVIVALINSGDIPFYREISHNDRMVVESFISSIVHGMSHYLGQDIGDIFPKEQQ